MGMCVNLFVEMNRLVGSCLVCLVKNKNQRRRKVSKKNGLPDVGDLGLTRLKNYQNKVDMKFILLVEFTFYLLFKIELNQFPIIVPKTYWVKIVIGLFKGGKICNYLCL